MGSIHEKIEKKDGSQLDVDESATVSTESSCRTVPGSRLSSGSSSSAQNLESSDLDSELRRRASKVSEMELMKERFAKLLLGEDMSGSGKGVCSALAISNAITNLWATVFGQLWRLEPLPSRNKTMWRREMDCLLCASDYIVELKPSWQTFPDGKTLEVMTSLPRSDLFINLPALRKLDAMLLEILDGFTNTEFWYVDQGVTTTQDNASFHKTCQRQEEKWWLPVPRVPPGGLSEATRKQLNQTRECASQILKAAMAINSIALADMEVPESYMKSLPTNGRACLGDVIYRYFASLHFSPDSLLDCLDASSEHIALEIANRVEAAAYVWRRRKHPKKLPPHSNRSAAKSSWLVMRDLMTDGGGDKRDYLAERADSFLRCLKQRFPALAQTTLDASKIQCNKDVGKAILESYSRVLESLAFNIVARIEDLLFVDTSRYSKKVTALPLMVPIPGTTPNRIITFSTPDFSPANWISTPRGERIPFLNGDVLNKPSYHRGGIGVRRVLMNYLSGDSKMRNCGNILDTLGSVSSRIEAEGTVSRLSMEVKEDYKIMRNK